MILSSGLLALTAAVYPLAADTDPTDGPYLGINLASVTYYSPQLVFVDAFRQARHWLPQNAHDAEWDTGEPLELNRDGWPLLAPGQAAGTLMNRDIDGHYPGGLYTCLYEGDGRIEFGFDAVVVSESPGRIVVDVTPSENGIYLKIAESVRQDPIRNIRMILPGFEDTYESQIFHPEFLERLRGFKTLRFMDWQHTNNSTVSAWGKRTKLSTYTQTLESGVAIELMLELCDRVDADAWFCMPHRAGDLYVRRFAELVRDYADEDVKIYLEHSNEVWNTRYEQTLFASMRGRVMGLSLNRNRAALLYHSQRSVEIFDIWEDVFGSTDRLVRVLATQAANSTSGQIVMDFQDAYLSADALAIAPYFGDDLGQPEFAPDTVNMSVDEVLDACEEDLVEVEEAIESNLSAACDRGLILLGYEGGQHLAGKDEWLDDEPLKELFFAANRHPRMRTVYQQYLSIWRHSGAADLLAYCTTRKFSKFGSWGALEWQDQSIYDAPKYRALRDELNRECPPPYNYCETTPNSVGSGAVMGWSGVSSVVFNNLDLEVSGLPSHAIGTFYYGPVQQQVPFTGGTICIANPTGSVSRLAINSPANGSGVAEEDLPLSNHDSWSPFRVGTRWNFQYFYRDPAFGPDILASDGLSVRVCP